MRIAPFLYFLLALFLGIGVYFWTMRLTIVSRFLSHNLSSEVEVSEVKIGFKELTIEGFKIKNPKKSAVNYALEIDKVVIRAFPLDFFKQNIPIAKLSIQSPKIHIEYYDEIGQDNNWAMFFTHLATSETHKTLTINNLDMLNVKFVGTNVDGKTIILWPIPYIEFNHIGVKKPVTLPQLTRLLFQTIFEKLMKDKYLPEKSLSVLEPISEELRAGVTNSLTTDEFHSSD